VEFFRNTNIDFLGKKWYFLGFSLVFSVAGILSMLFWHHVPLGIDFRGGTLVYVKFAVKPVDAEIRTALDKAGLHNANFQTYGPASANEMVIRLDEKDTNEADISRGKDSIIAALETSPVAGKKNINNSDRIGMAAVRAELADVILCMWPLRNTTRKPAK
jgi:preprotein translocase subunit SecF